MLMKTSCRGGQSSLPRSWALLTWSDIISLIPLALSLHSKPHPPFSASDCMLLGQMFTSTVNAPQSQSLGTRVKACLAQAHCDVHTYPMPSVRRGWGAHPWDCCWDGGWEIVVPGAMLLPLPSSISHWCPKGSRLEVSSSEVAGSNLISWIWKNSGLRGPSGRLYWKRNKWACWEGAVLV